MLTDAELASMRHTAEDAMPDTAAVSRSSKVSDNAGGLTVTWASVANDVPCAFAPASAQDIGEAVTADRFTASSRWTVTLPAETDVRLADRLVISARTFEVESIRAGRTFEITRRVLCREIT